MDVVAVVLAVLLLLSVAFALGLWRSTEKLRRNAAAVASGAIDELPSSGSRSAVETASALNKVLKASRDAAVSAGEERDLLASAIETASDGIIAVGHDRNLALANSAARRLLQPSSVRPGLPVAQAVRDHEVVSAIERALHSGDVDRVSLEYGPERRQLQIVVNPLPPAGAWAALLVIHDLSDRRRIERTRREFISNVSHELRTPLASVKAAVETLENGALADVEAAPSFLSSIHGEVDRMTQMVEELLELSRIEGGALPFALEPLEIKPVVERAVGRIVGQARRKGLELRVEIPPAIPRVRGDSARLEQALVNLLHNAVKFTPEGGVEVLVDSDESRVVVAVNDSGNGITKADLPHIFERFYKADRARSSDGTGLGLAIVKHTVQAHGGSVWVESDLDRGSTFTIALPRADVPA